MAPEYAMHGLVSPKVDVFSFGVLVLEIVTRRSNCGSDDYSAVNLLSDVSAGRVSLHPHLTRTIKLILLDDPPHHFVSGLGSLDERVDTADAGGVGGRVRSSSGDAMHPRRPAVRPGGA
jgi:hypothetical protein